jgi:O-antigen/teichoic acid export membrane protein
MLRLVFGSAFLPAVPAFIWLMPGSFFLGVETVLVQFLNSLGFPKAIIGAWLVVVTLNIAANLWAIPAYGIVGASVVSTICYFAIFVFIAGIVWNTVRSESLLRIDQGQLGQVIG